MARIKGKFCKATTAERIERLAKAREARWTKEHHSQPSSSQSTPITDLSIPYADHAYTCAKPSGEAAEAEGLIDTWSIVGQQEKVQDAEATEFGWRSGRRIAMLGVLADGLQACQLCGHPRHLKDCVGEKKFGLAHILLVRCSYMECGLVNDVPTGSKHKTSNRASAWDVKTKLAEGMINGGFGESHINGLLSALNIPTLTQASLKSREREITLHLNKMAEDSCNKHLDEEISLSDGNLTAGFDGVWQKRGTGRAYNSLTD